MKLTPGGKIVIFLILGLVAFFLIKRFLPSKPEKFLSQTDTSSTTNERLPGNPKKVSDNSSNSSERRSFDYIPEKPVNGVLKGVVEVGATGFNSFVVKMDKQRRWEIVSKDFGESLAYEGLATTDDIRIGLKKYLSGMFDKGVNKKDMHFVISSGAQLEPKTITISNELKKMGYVVNLVTAEEEGNFALKATIPPSFQDNSFLVDIGSGTSKISWTEGGQLRTVDSYGAKYYQNGKSDDEVYNAVKREAVKVPKSKQNVCFIIGGVPFTLAKQHRSGDERFTVLNLPDSYKAADQKMAAGLNIYKSIVDVTKCDTFVFDWDANFTIGFLLSLPIRE